ncbi:MAG: hypothetical protein GX815_08730 [Clostridiales bacterium]|nr:hypothetical protein [Clostridiales bacterium]
MIYPLLSDSTVHDRNNNGKQKRVGLAVDHELEKTFYLEDKDLYNTIYELTNIQE